MAERSIMAIIQTMNDIIESLFSSFSNVNNTKYKCFYILIVLSNSDENK